MKTYKYVLGIDLGTTNTVACYMRRGKLELVRFPGSGTMLPSVIYVEEDGSIAVGNKAKNKGVADRANMIRSSKTWIGDAEANKTWLCRGRELTPTDVATEILKEVRRQYVKQAGCEENEAIGAVITVPAYFRSAQKDETRTAGINAGFEVIQIIPEPMAAAVAAVQGMALLDKKVFVVDIGGGTFDLSVLSADSGNHEYNVLDTDGDPRLGGDDFDMAVALRLRRVLADDNGVDLSGADAAGMDEPQFAMLMDALADAAENAKKELSQSSEADINLLSLPGLSDSELDMTLSVEDFDDICKPLYDRILERTRAFLLNNANFSPDDIGELILAGGTCSIPYLQRAIVDLTGLQPRSEMNRSYLVAYGACYVANLQNGSSVEVKINDILSHSMGVEVEDEGAGIFCKLLEKGTVYPCEITRDGFSTVQDNQERIHINVYEAGPDGEDVREIDAHKLYGTLVLEGIERAPKGEPNIEITFKYDLNSCLTVSARDVKTGASKSFQFKKGVRGEAAAQGEAPMDIMLLLDSSGSMSGTRIAQAIEASMALIQDIVDLSVHRMGIISFADRARLLQTPTSDADALVQCLGRFTTGGGTQMSNALQTVVQHMKEPRGRKVVILVTDGEDFEPDHAEVTGNRMKRDDYRIFTIGVGDKVDKDFLARLASPGDSYTIDNMAELRDTFERVISGLTRK